MLVDMGDKRSNFIGSTNWIGAIEISLCLNQLYGVFVCLSVVPNQRQIDSSVIHCTSGSEIAKKGNELVVHFQTNATPIMIGLVNFH